MKRSIHDWIVELQWSNKNIVKGVNETKKLLNSIEKIHVKANRGVELSLKRQTTELGRQNQVLKRREQIVNSTAKKMGMGSTIPRLKVPGQSSTVGSKSDPEAVRYQKALLEMEKRATREKKEQAQLDRIRLQHQAKYNAQQQKAERNFSKRQNRELGKQANFDASKNKVATDIRDFQQQALAMKMSAERAAELQKRISVLKQSLSTATDPIALKNIRTELVSTRRAAQMFTAQQRAMNKEMTASKFAINGVVGSLKNMARSYLSVFAASAGAVTVVNQMKELDTIKSTFLAASGSARQAAIDFEYVRQTALKLGTDLASSAKGYSQMAIAGREAGLATSQVRDIFESASEAAIAFGLSVDDQAGVQRAFVQMLSKNRVTAEELGLSRLAA